MTDLKKVRELTDSEDRLQVFFGYFKNESEDKLRSELQRGQEWLRVQKNRLLVVARNKLQESQEVNVSFESQRDSDSSEDDGQKSDEQVEADDEVHEKL